MESRPSSHSALRAWCFALCTAVLAACGGGGSSPAPAESTPIDSGTGVGGGGTGGGGGGTGDVSDTVSRLSVSGTVTGFGSVILDGKRYDDRAAAVAVDRGASAPAVGTLDDLKLGMNIEGTVVNGQLTDVVVRAKLEGPVGAIDSANSLFTVWGQSVKVQASGATPTMFEGASSLADLQVGDRVEVHGSMDAARVISATRVERKPAAEAAPVRVAGTVSGLDTTAKTFLFNDLTVHYAAASVEPASRTLANGQLVVAVGATAPAAGNFSATRLRISGATEGEGVGIGGKISAFVSSSDFTVAGLHVDASRASVETGALSDLAVGVAVRAEGVVTAGVLKATKLAVIKTSSDALASLKGEVSDFASTASFKLRGTPVDASGASFVGGTAADLGNGSWVIAQGRTQGDMFVATQVEFKTPPAAQPVKLTGELRDWSATERTLRLMGMAARLATDVSFERITLAQLANGVRIEATGIPDAQGVIVISRIVFLGEPTAARTVVVGGRIGSLGEGSFQVPGMLVRWDSNTTFVGGSAADLAHGVMLLAKGSYEPQTRSITANWVEIIKTDTAVPRVAGPVSEFATLSDFRVGSQRVDASQAIILDGTAADLANGVLIAAQGTMAEANGGRVLRATKVRILQK